MHNDDEANEQELRLSALGEITSDLISQLADRVVGDVPDELMAEALESVSRMQPHEVAVFTLGQVLGQLAIKHDDQRLFYASITCLWFSGAMESVSMDGVDDIVSMLNFSESLWVRTREEVAEIISENVDKMLKDI